MKRLFSYFAFLLTLSGAVLTLLQSLYLVELRFSLLPFAPHLNSVPLILAKGNVEFVQHVAVGFLIISINEIFLFWLLVILNVISRSQGLISTLILVMLIGFIVLVVLSV